MHLNKMFMFFLTLFLLTGCSLLMEWQTKYPDNAVEELAEDTIEDFTGLNIDITPVTGKETEDFDFFKKK